MTETREAKNAQKEREAKTAKEEGKTSVEQQGIQKDIQINELIDTLKRVQADYENYRKRVDRDAAELKKYAAKSLVVRLLPVLDSFELALTQSKQNGQDEPIKDEHVKGIEIIYSQLFSILSNEGLQRIECVGKRFNPLEHEVLLTEEHDGEADIVLEELQKGYTLHDLVIRPAKVKLSRKRAEASA